MAEPRKTRPRFVDQCGTKRLPEISRAGQKCVLELRSRLQRKAEKEDIAKPLQGFGPGVLRDRPRVPR